MGVSVCGDEAGRSRVQSPNPRDSLLSPLLLLFIFSTISSLSLSVSPSGGVVVVCLLFLSYRLHLPYSAPAAPRLLHRLQRCRSSSGGSSSLSHGLCLLSVVLQPHRRLNSHSTFFQCLLLYRLLPVRENKVRQRIKADLSVLGAPHWGEALAVQLEGMVIKAGAGFKTLLLNNNSGDLSTSILALTCLPSLFLLDSTTSCSKCVEIM